MKIRIFLLLLITCSAASGYEPEQAMMNQAHELAECSAYYSMMSGCAENTKPGDPMSDGLMDIARQAFVFSTGLSNVKVTEARVELAIKQLNEESMGQCSNSSILINKYAKVCLEAIQSPEKRAQYWLEKE